MFCEILFSPLLHFSELIPCIQAGWNRLYITGGRTCLYWYKKSLFYIYFDCALDNLFYITPLPQTTFVRASSSRTFASSWWIKVFLELSSDSQAPCVRLLASCESPNGHYIKHENCFSCWQFCSPLCTLQFIALFFSLTLWWADALKWKVLLYWYGECTVLRQKRV